MIFHVHTTEGVLICDAKNPADARRQVAIVRPEAHIKKVKLEGGQRNKRDKSDAKLPQS